MRFLLIEDDKITREVLERCLVEMFGGADEFELKCCDTIKEARDLYITRDPHTIFLDLTLLDSSCDATIHQIPFFAKRADVVIVSGSDDATVRERCFEFGAMDYLDKAQIVNRDFGYFSFLRFKSRVVASYLRAVYGRKSNRTP